jgi:hypothetical protein
MLYSYPRGSSKAKCTNDSATYKCLNIKGSHGISAFGDYPGIETIPTAISAI